MKAYKNSLTDQQIIAYLRGEVDDELTREIEQNPEILEQVAAFMQNGMQSIPFPETVSSTELSAYHLGLLSDEHTQAVETYLAQAPGRQIESMMLESYLADLDGDLPNMATETVGIEPMASQSIGSWESVKKSLIRIANLVHPPEGTFNLLGEDDQQRVYEVGEIQIFIYAQEDEEVPNRKALFGLISGLENEGLIARLWRPDQTDEIANAEVDPFGNFVVPSLEPDRYELILDGPGVEIHIQDVQI